jgi:hypothetical protein
MQESFVIEDSAAMGINNGFPALSTDKCMNLAGRKPKELSRAQARNH